MRILYLVALGALSAGTAQAADFEVRVIGGTVQLGGKLVVSLLDQDKTLPEGARCRVTLPAPYDGYLSVEKDDCRQLTLQGAHAPILDDTGHALPSAQVPYGIVATAPDGAEAGRVSGMFPYQNQFSDIRIVIDGIRNPVSPGQSFPVHVLGAGAAVDAALTCRWHFYGPVKFAPASENGCEGKLTATRPGGRDADMDVEIVNLTDMHAVGYGTAKMLVE